jgi:hypothetical protein
MVASGGGKRCANAKLRIAGGTCDVVVLLLHLCIKMIRLFIAIAHAVRKTALAELAGDRIDFARRVETSRTNS